MRVGMKNQDVYDLMDRFEKSGIARMKFESGDTSLELEKTIAVSGVPAVAAAPMAQPAVCGVEAASAQEPEAGLFIKAPMVGTFYVASSPDAQPYVNPGDVVHAGDTVCMLEAMKMMSEVSAPCDCIIEELLVADGELVSFDQPLIRYRES